VNLEGYSRAYLVESVEMKKISLKLAKKSIYGQRRGVGKEV
jgi:hypothetical protein